VGRRSEEVSVPKGAAQRRLHKAFLRYHDANNWPLLRKALKKMGRADLIGNGKRHLIPAWQPKGTGEQAEGRRAGKTFRTQHTGLRNTGLPKAGSAKNPRKGLAAGKAKPARKKSRR
jgi:hypothetical protein